jgi:cell wall-associated NlpC family hydrolase
MKLRRHIPEPARALATLSLFLGMFLSPAEAQVEARIGRFYDGGGWTAYRLGLNRQLGPVLGVQVHGDLLRPAGGEAGGFAGLGTDLTVFRKHEGPYLIAGLSAGLGSQSSNSYSKPWGSWSAGAGYDLSPLSFISVGTEARWRSMSAGRHGFEFGLGLALHVGRGTRAYAPRKSLPVRNAGIGTTALPSTGPEPQGTPVTLVDSIIATAAEAMGRPYEYGGTGAGGEGFDCSGLIQYAYGKHGIQLPRRSTDQAREGKKIDRKLDHLRAGDLLTFSNRGGAVTHVGLYIGNGRFIHSATRGVQASVLSAADPYGRWWYKRWVGVRRIVQ